MYLLLNFLTVKYCKYFIVEVFWKKWSKNFASDYFLLSAVSVCCQYLPPYKRQERDNLVSREIFWCSNWIYREKKVCQLELFIYLKYLNHLTNEQPVWTLSLYRKDASLLLLSFYLAPHQQVSQNHASDQSVRAIQHQLRVIILKYKYFKPCYNGIDHKE